MRAELSNPNVSAPEQLEWYEKLDIAILVYYLIEYLLKIGAAQHRLSSILNSDSVCEFVTITPIFLFSLDTLTSVVYIRITRIFRLLRVVSFVFKFNKFGETEVSQQIFKIMMTILTLIFFTAGILEAVENPFRVRNPSLKYTTTSLHEQIYFVVVTLSTVGYGDVTPVSELGQLCVMLFILFALVIIPKQTNELIRLMGMQSYYARAIYKPNAEMPHILISGYVGVSALKNFCVELFHPDHGSQDKNAIILQQNNPSVEMINFMHQPQYELHLTYLQGNPMIDKDLRRASATKARACVLLTNKYIADSYSADHKNILIGLAIKKHVHHYTGGANIRLIMQLIKPDSKTHFYSSLNMKSNDQLIVIEEIKMNLLAKSCLSPGIISMLSNLTASVGDVDQDEDKDWLKEYTTGMGHEIYRTDISPKLIKDKKFAEVAAIVYNKFQGILFGLELEIAGHTIIRLNPGSYFIPHQEDIVVHVYMICEDKQVADQVATYEMLSEEVQSYHQQKNQRSKKSEIKSDRMLDYSYSTDDDARTTDQEKSAYSQEDEELLESDYNLLPEAMNLMQVTMISIEDNTSIVNHIVVCGIHPSIYYFLLPLRAKYLKDLQHVVILSPEPPANEMWDYLSRFPKLIYIKGSPLLQEDLRRANINYADKAVILGQDSSNMKDGIVNDEMLDAESIFIYKAIKKCNKNVQIMTDLVYSSNIEFLLPKDAKRDESPKVEFRHELTPLFAAGEVYISSIIDTLTSQAYYNPHIVTIVQQLVTGGKQSSTMIRNICDLADLKQSNLWQIPIPEDYLNKTFGELFNYLAAERELIPLGLYRLPNSTDNKYPYVYTNPPPTTKLTHRDKVFVLAANMPNDLLDGYADPKKFKAGGETGGFTKTTVGAMSQHHTTNAGSHTQISFDKDEHSRIKNQDSTIVRQDLLNKSRDVDSRKREAAARPIAQNFIALAANAANRKFVRPNESPDVGNLNQHSAISMVLDQVSNTVRSMDQEIQNIRESMEIQEEQILDKVRSALKTEISTLGR